MPLSSDWSSRSRPGSEADQVCVSRSYLQGSEHRMISDVQSSEEGGTRSLSAPEDLDGAFGPGKGVEAAPADFPSVSLRITRTGGETASRSTATHDIKRIVSLCRPEAFPTRSRSTGEATLGGRRMSSEADRGGSAPPAARSRRSQLSLGWPGMMTDEMRRRGFIVPGFRQRVSSRLARAFGVGDGCRKGGDVRLGSAAPERRSEGTADRSRLATGSVSRA